MTETGCLSTRAATSFVPAIQNGHGRNETEVVMLGIEGRLLRDCIGTVLQRPDRVIQSDCLTLGEISERLESLAEPDLVIVSLSADDLTSAFATIRLIRVGWRHTRWIVLSRSAGHDFIRDGIKSGVDGFLQEDSPVEVLRLVTDLVLLGHSPLPAGIARLLADPPASCKPIELGAAMPAAARQYEESQDWADSLVQRGQISRALSGRERDILHCLSQGMSNKVIARELMIAEATVKAHVKALLRKMQVRNRTQAAICATRVLNSTGHRGPATSTFHGAVPTLTSVAASGPVARPALSQAAIGMNAVSRLPTIPTLLAS